MAQYKRQEIKMTNRGLNLTRPQDLLETETVPYCLNMRQYFQGAFQHRPGLNAINMTALADLNVHSAIRLNDYAFGTFSRFIGAGDSLYSNDSSPASFVERASGFSSKPLALSVMRPPQSPEPWLYVGDSDKSGKVRVDGTFYGQGIAPPTIAAYAQPSATPYKLIDNFELVGGWANGGTAGTITAVTRVSTTIAKITYDSGTTGWATVSPTILNENIQPGMLLIVNAGETVLVEYVSEAVTTTTIASVQYDLGTTGACTIQLTAPTNGLARDSMLLLDSGGGAEEAVRVLSVTDGPGGLPSFRCRTVNTQTAGNSVTGQRSFRANFTGNHAVGETLTSNDLETSIATGVGYLTLVTTLDLSSVNGRPITGDDEIHISLQVDSLDLLTEGRIEVDVDAAVNDFTQNYYYWPFRANDLTLAATDTITTLAAQQRVIQRTQIDNTYLPTLESRLSRLGGDVTLIEFPTTETAPPTQTVLGVSQWTELRIKVRDLLKFRVGSDSSRTLHDVAAIRIQLQVTGTVTLGVDAWWIGGTFGADSLPSTSRGAPYNYRYVYRSMLTGAQSNPSPPLREGVLPRRQQVMGTVTASLDPQVDWIDIYRTGGALITIDNSPPWFYVMSIPNSSPTFMDDYADDVVIRNRQLDFDSFQPFLDTDVPRSGTCSVVGTEVTRIGGDVFNTRWPAGTVIVINSIPYTLYVQPSSAAALSLNESAGTQANVNWYIQNPRLMAQPLPSMWGPYGGGTFLPVLFACGSQLQPGHLFYTKPGNADANSQFGFVEITSPSEPLINGVVFRAQAFVFSSESLYILTPAIVGSELTFTAQRVAGNRGLFSRYAMCVGDEGIFYLSRDGIYLTAGGQSISLTDEMLYPLFVHEGAPPVTTNGIAPPDFCAEGDLRLSYGESVVYFDFIDINGDRATLLYDIKLKGWFYYKYAPGVTFHYFEEGKNLNTLLMGAANGKIYLSGGNTDDGTAIPCAVDTGWYDGGDPRSNKQWANGMLDFAGHNVEVRVRADFDSESLGTVTVSSN